MVYEGVLSPGETLYIPPGAAHAAHALDDSLMIASNDHSVDSLDVAERACRVARASRNLAVTYRCEESNLHDAALHARVRQYRAKNPDLTVVRRAKPLLKARHCPFAQRALKSLITPL